MTESSRVLVAAGAGLAFGAAIAMGGSASLLAAADLLQPIGSMWVNAIRMTVIPLVVSLIITGIASASGRSLGGLGGRTALVFVLLLAGTALVVMPFAPAVFTMLPSSPAGRMLPAGAVDASAQVAAIAPQASLSAFVVSLVPPNPVAAAVSGAMLPLVIFTVLFALAIAYSAPPSRMALLSFFQSLAETMLALVRWVILLAPIGVFALILPMAARGGAQLAGAFGFYMLAYSLACVLVVLLTYPAVALVARIPVRRFARALLPVQVIAFGSSSSLATLPAMVEGAESGLALSKRVTGFVLPVAVALFKLGAPVSWTVGALFVGWFYGVAVGPAALAIIAVASIFLSFATPGVPNGAFLLLTPLFTSIGLPAEGIGLLIALDAIPDRFATVLNVTGDMAAAAVVGARDPQRAQDEEAPAA